MPTVSDNWVCLDRDDPCPEYKLENDKGLAHVWRAEKRWFFGAHTINFKTSLNGHADSLEFAMQLAQAVIS